MDRRTFLGTAVAALAPASGGASIVDHRSWCEPGRDGRTMEFHTGRISGLRDDQWTEAYRMIKSPRNGFVRRRIDLEYGQGDWGFVILDQEVWTA